MGELWWVVYVGDELLLVELIVCVVGGCYVVIYLEIFVIENILYLVGDSKYWVRLMYFGDVLFVFGE